MQRNVIAPVVAVLVLCALVLVTGCTKPEELNKPPVFSSFTAAPADSVLLPGSTVTLTVAATDADEDTLTFTWSAKGGALSGTTGDSVVWTAPSAAKVCTIAVSCSDGDTAVDTSYVVRARAWQQGEIEFSTDDSTDLPNVGTTEVPFFWDSTGARRSGATVDSVVLTVDFDEVDSLEILQFNLYLISPAGTEVLLYDGVSLTDLEGDWTLADFAGEVASYEGWKLKFVRNNPGRYNAVVETCEMVVHYKY